MRRRYTHFADDQRARSESRKLEGQYPWLALFIEVTKEDFFNVYEGKLIAPAESSGEPPISTKSTNKRGGAI
jgi:hypothetical protein